MRLITWALVVSLLASTFAQDVNQGALEDLIASTQGNEDGKTDQAKEVVEAVAQVMAGLSPETPVVSESQPAEETNPVEASEVIEASEAGADSEANTQAPVEAVEVEEAVDPVPPAEETPQPAQSEGAMTKKEKKNVAKYNEALDLVMNMLSEKMRAMTPFPLTLTVDSLTDLDTTEPEPEPEPTSTASEGARNKKKGKRKNKNKKNKRNGGAAEEDQEEEEETQVVEVENSNKKNKRKNANAADSQEASAGGKKKRKNNNKGDKKVKRRNKNKRKNKKNKRRNSGEDDGLSQREGRAKKDDEEEGRRKGSIPQRSNGRRKNTRNNKNVKNNDNKNNNNKGKNKRNKAKDDKKNNNKNKRDNKKDNKKGKDNKKNNKKNNKKRNRAGNAAEPRNFGESSRLHPDQQERLMSNAHLTGLENVQRVGDVVLDTSSKNLNVEVNFEVGPLEVQPKDKTRQLTKATVSTSLDVQARFRVKTVRGRERIKLLSLTVDSLTPEEVQVIRNDIDIDPDLLSTAQETVVNAIDTVRLGNILTAELENIFQEEDIVQNFDSHPALKFQ